MTAEINLSNVIEIFVFGFTIVGVYVKMQSKITELDIRLKNAEGNGGIIMKKLDKIGEDIADIKIELQNKQDRP